MAFYHDYNRLAWTGGSVYCPVTAELRTLRSFFCCGNLNPCIITGVEDILDIVI